MRHYPYVPQWFQWLRVVYILFLAILAGLIFRLWIVRIKQAKIKRVMPPLATLIWFGMVVNDAFLTFIRLSDHAPESWNAPVGIVLCIGGIVAMRQVLSMQSVKDQ
jgi:hypothetical protein